uniref:NB-ARC domain-containing protein n=1 Tax=Leersia perrieri TaxID=77586 RepID=A0A0D9XQY3_9ORYZ
MEHTMVSVATGVLSTVLRKLTTLVEKQCNNKFKGVNEEILSMKAELQSMNALLLKLADMDDLDVQVKEWRNQIRELSYDIEDCIDNFMHQTDGGTNRDHKGFLKKSIQKLRTIGVRNEIADQILKLKARVDGASERQKRYNFNGAISNYSNVVRLDPRLPALFEEADALVGMDEPTEVLINWLTRGEKRESRLSVVSLVGFGGLGKTTLARQVYNKIGGQFECQAFVSISQKPDMRKIFHKMLNDIKRTEHTSLAWDEEQLMGRLGTLDEEQLISKLREFLTGRSYPDLNNVYELKPLSSSDAKKLFMKRIFGSEDQCPSQLKLVSNDILRKCGGLPLAIISIASLLANKPCTKELWESYRNSIGSQFEKDPSVNDMQRILSLSYNDLPHYLKTCLLYLSIYPENFIIKRAPLVMRWIAEGFITRDGRQNLEETAEYYFNELINRSMIIPVSIQYDGRVDSCRVHDVILDLIISKSAEENFITAFGYQNHVLGPQDKIRRLSFDYRGQEEIMVPSNATVLNVRSLTTYGSTAHVPLLSDFQVLRTISIDCNDHLENHHLNGIERLFCLKYLRLNRVSINKLPEQIGELQQLETIDLTQTMVKELPKSIVKLKKLMFLLADEISLPAGIGNMNALQKLYHMKVDNGISSNTLNELQSLTELRYLGIIWCVNDMYASGKSQTDKFVSSISTLCKLKLRYLHVQCDAENGSSLDFLLDYWFSIPNPLQYFGMSSRYYFPRIPEWIALLSSVTFLNININHVGEEVFQILGDLPSLLALRLWTQGVARNERLIIRSRGFLYLKQLVFYSCNIEMNPLLFEDGAMPNLERFRFNLKARETRNPCSEFFLSIQHMSSLKHLLVLIDCRDATAHEVEAKEAAIREATNHLCKHFQVEINTNWTWKMVKDDEDIDIKCKAEDSTKHLREWEKNV